jgi:hypothetical protein
MAFINAVSFLATFLYEALNVAFILNKEFKKPTFLRVGFLGRGS